MTRSEEDARVVVDGHHHRISRHERLVFGRDPQPGVVGLDSTDMGISAIAGSVEFDGNRWIVSNRSLKRPLLIEAPAHQGRLRLACGRSYVLCDPHVIVLVPGLTYTHRVEVDVPAQDLKAGTPTAGEEGATVVVREMCNEADLDALTALFRGYLESFPRRNCHPLKYKQAAELLGVSEDALRRRVENFRARLARTGVADIGGDKALYDLAEFLLDHGVIRPDDLARLRRGTANSSAVDGR